MLPGTGTAEQSTASDLQLCSTMQDRARTRAIINCSQLTHVREPYVA
jgi:hypothetical protein